MINANAYHEEMFRFMSTLNPHEYTSQSFHKAIQDHMYEFATQCWDRRERGQQILLDALTHVLVSPPVSSDPSEIIYGSEVTIKQADFKAFCDTYKLPHDRMLLLSEGKIKEVKGWTRSNKMSPHTYGSTYQPPKAQMSQGEKRKREIELQKDKQRQEQLKYKTPVQSPSFTFNPDNPQPIPTPSTSNNVKTLVTNLLNR